MYRKFTTGRHTKNYIRSPYFYDLLLLDIAPKPDGTIPDEQVAILKDLGRWTNKHKTAIYGTRAGIPHGHFNGYTALNKEGNILYLYVDNNPNGPLLIKGLKNKVNRIWVVGNGTKLEHKVVGKQYWSKVPGSLYINLPDLVQDKDVTVLAVLLDGKRHGMQCSVGSKVVYAKFGVKKLDYQGEEYLICKEADLLIIIED